MNNNNAHLTRKSFLTLCGASILSACSRQQDLMLIKESAESLFPPLGKVEKIDDLDAVKSYYGYSNEKAKSALSILSDTQLSSIKQKLTKGGKQ